MSKSISELTKYSFIAISPAGKVLKEAYPDNPIETASSIKSPLASVALRQASDAQIDTSSYTMTVAESHIPKNATTFMQDSLGESLSLDEIIEKNIVQSDATATNMLIEFAGGRDGVNEGLGRIGLNATRILQDKLDFTELQEPNLDPIFGISTAREMAKYYQDLIANSSDQPWTKDFIQLHSKLKNIRFFSTKAEHLLPGTSFLHKTGSIFSTEIPQAVLVDAGHLVSKDFPDGVFVTGALATYRERGLRGINTEFSNLNCNQLGINREDVCDHPLILQPEPLSA